MRRLRSCHWPLGPGRRPVLALGGAEPLPFSESLPGWRTRAVHSSTPRAALARPKAGLPPVPQPPSWPALSPRYKDGRDSVSRLWDSGRGQGPALQLQSQLSKGRARALAWGELPSESPREGKWKVTPSVGSWGRAAEPGVCGAPRGRLAWCQRPALPVPLSSLHGPPRARSLMGFMGRDAAPGPADAEQPTPGLTHAESALPRR